MGLEQSRLDEAWNAFDLALDIARKNDDKALEFNTLASLTNTAAFADDSERLRLQWREHSVSFHKLTSLERRQ